MGGGNDIGLIGGPIEARSGRPAITGPEETQGRDERFLALSRDFAKTLGIDAIPPQVPFIKLDGLLDPTDNTEWHYNPARDRDGNVIGLNLSNVQGDRPSTKEGIFHLTEGHASFAGYVGGRLIDTDSHRNGSGMAFEMLQKRAKNILDPIKAANAARQAYRPQATRAGEGYR